MNGTYYPNPRARSALPGYHRALVGILSLVLAFSGTLLGAKPAGAGAATGQPNWTQLQPSSSPPARSDASTAFDPATGQLVLFGGSNGSGGYRNDTWIWNGITWSQASPGSGPSVREGASMAFDPATGQLVLFGGLDSSGALNDMWTWDGSSWSPLFPATNPPAREYASMAFDPATGQLVLFGGLSSTGNLNDTWSWNGSDWSQASPGPGPSAPELASMAYDPATGQLVLFGGFNLSGHFLSNQTWTWNGTTWIQLHPSSSPSARDAAGMTFDEATGQLVLFGGFAGTNSYLNDTWAWDGTTWTQRTPASSPPARELVSMAFDPATGQLVLFGGANTGTTFNETWIYTVSAVTNDWTQLSPTISPSARDFASMAFDPATGQLVLFGGASTGTTFNETWTWDGSTWSQRSPTTSPPPARVLASMAFDPATGQLVLFGGGDSNNGYLNDTWTWNGSTWTQVSPGSGPSAREGASMAYDSATGQLVLFGGVNGSTSLNDTWTWNGSNWTQLSPGTSPPAREYASLAFDPASGQLVLFGGADLGTRLNDTWTWNGSDWTSTAPTTSPSAREFASMAYDSATGQLVLFSGFDGAILNQTWMWNGSDWTQLSPATSPQARDAASMAFDPATGQLVLFGGFVAKGNFLNDTWAYVPIIPVPPAPGTPVATQGNSTIGLTWTDPNPTIPVTEYDVQCAVVGGSGSCPNPLPGGIITNASGGTPATSTTITGLDFGTTYSFTVTGTNGGGTGAVSPASNAVIFATTPDQPQSLTATPGDGQVTLTWTQTSTGGIPLTGYTIASTCTPSCLSPLSGSASPDASGKTTSSSSVSTGSFSAVKSATVNGATPAQYALTIGGLTNGTTYTFRLTVSNDLGSSPQSAPSNSVVPSAPSPTPTNTPSATATNTPTATPTNTPTASPSPTPTRTTVPPSAPLKLSAATARVKGVQLKWQAPTTGAATITAYKVYRGTGAGAEAYLTTLGVVTSYNDTATTATIKYYYKVSAVNAGGEGALSVEASAKAR
jgi:fibronectin type III domain protein/galactose oxidase-like protein